VPPASRGSAIGTYHLIADVAMVFVGPAAGLIASHLGYGGVYFGAAACVGAAAVIAALLLAVRRRRATFIDAAPGLRHRPAVPGQT
jgi:MFS family permease